jgi:hypothetical protein
MAENGKAGLEEENSQKKSARINIFDRAFLTVADFELEQSYFSGKRHLVKGLVHGVGLICGLKVVGTGADPNIITRDTDGRWAIKISPGWAIDTCGREIIVGNDLSVGIMDTPKDQTTFGIFLRRIDRDRTLCEEVSCYNRIFGNNEILFDLLPNPNDKLNDPKILLTIVSEKGEGTLQIESDIIPHHRPMVYDNVMLQGIASALVHERVRV